MRTPTSDQPAVIGLEPLRAQYEGFLSAFPGAKLTPVRIIDSGEPELDTPSSAEGWKDSAEAAAARLTFVRTELAREAS